MTRKLPAKRHLIFQVTNWMSFWPCLAKTVPAGRVKEFQPSKTNSEELFLKSLKKDGESYLVYSKHLERLYRESFAITPGTELNSQSTEAIKRQFLRGINHEIAQKLKLDNPDDPLDKLITRAK